MKKLCAQVLLILVVSTRGVVSVTYAAEPSDQTWSDSETKCHTEGWIFKDQICVTTPTEAITVQAYRDLMAMYKDPHDGKRNRELVPKATSVVAGIVWGAGNLAAYRETVHTTGTILQVSEKQTAIVAEAVRGAVEPELRSVGSLLLHANGERAARGVAQLTADEVKVAIAKALQNPSVRGRIVMQLEERLGKEGARAAFQRLLGERSAQLFSENFAKLAKMGLKADTAEGTEALAKIAGKMLAGDVARSVAPATARKILLAAAAEAATTDAAAGVAKTFGARCLGYAGSTVRVATGKIALAAGLLLDPAPLRGFGELLEDGTLVRRSGENMQKMATSPFAGPFASGLALTGFLLDNDTAQKVSAKAGELMKQMGSTIESDDSPQAMAAKDLTVLLDLPEQQALSWIRHESWLRSKIIKVRDTMKATRLAETEDRRQEEQRRQQDPVVCALTPQTDASSPFTGMSCRAQ